MYILRRFYHHDDNDMTMRYFFILVLQSGFTMFVHRLCYNIYLHRQTSKSGLATNVQTAAFFQTANEIPEKTQPEANDFNYVKLV